LTTGSKTKFVQFGPNENNMPAWQGAAIINDSETATAVSNFKLGKNI
jgi:hypothetical protein